MRTNKIPLRIVVYPQGTNWVAHCLEFDLACDGASKEEAMSRLADGVLSRLVVGVQEELFAAADEKYSDLFDAGIEAVWATIELGVSEPAEDFRFTSEAPGPECGDG